VLGEVPLLSFPLSFEVLKMKYQNLQPDTLIIFRSHDGLQEEKIEHVLMKGEIYIAGNFQVPVNSVVWAEGKDSPEAKYNSQFHNLLAGTKVNYRSPYGLYNTTGEIVRRLEEGKEVFYVCREGLKISEYDILSVSDQTETIYYVPPSDDYLNRAIETALNNVFGPTTKKIWTIAELKNASGG
jgi:hypothetical protein